MIPRFIETEQFLRLLRPQAPMAAEPVLLEHIRYACADFSRETTAFRYEHEPVPVSEGLQDVELDAPLADSYVKSILYARIENRELQPLRPDEAAFVRPALRDASRDVISQFWCPERGVIRFIGIPNSALGNLYVTSSIMLGINTDEVPESFLIEHSDAIQSGALYTLLSVPNQPWTNMQLAAYHRQRFLRAVTSERQAQHRGGITKAQKAYPKSRFV